MNLNIDSNAFHNTITRNGCVIYPQAGEHDPDGSLCFRFTRREVASGDASRLLALIAPEILNASTLRSLQGTLVIQLPTPAARHEEPFLCATTRQFCRVLYSTLPAWAFFLTLENLALWRMTLALVEDAQIVQRERAWETRVIVPNVGLEDVVSGHVIQAGAMARRADLSMSEIDRLLEAIRAYFRKVADAYSTLAEPIPAG